jgi:Spirocyclase AveC-like
MTTKHSDLAVHRVSQREKPSVAPWVWLGVCLLLIGVIAYFARYGAVSPRIANPQVTGVPRPVEFLFGWSDTAWLKIHEWGTVLGMIWLFLGCLRVWRRQPGHPYVLMATASTAIVWQDPIMNWAPYAVYNPQLWHWPEDWPLIQLSPSVEPFIVIGYAIFYFGPFFPATSILRKLQARASMDAFVWRHPLWSLAGIVLVVGFLFDAALEMFLVRTGLYVYSQVIPWGSTFAGTTFQFPLIFESVFVCFVMIPAAVLCYRDDSGRTQAERLVQRLRWLPNHPTLATFLMMFAFLNVAYAVYGGSFALIRSSGLATSVACPNPYPEAKLYDPQGYFEREGAPGPYHQGFWNTWATGHDGRPAHNPVKADGHCKRAH